MLTPRQHELLIFIDAKIRQSGSSPTFTEMAKALGLKSNAGIFRILDALEDRRFIRRLPQRARAVEVLRLPGEDLAAEAVAAIKLRRHAIAAGLGAPPELWAVADAAEDAVLAKWDAAHG